MSNMGACKSVVINKNRGWRGLAEVKVLDDTASPVITSIFSFSQPVWDDLMKGTIVVQDDDYYYVIKLADTSKLPIGHQRSVLLKNFKSDIEELNMIEKATWPSTNGDIWNAIYRFLKNRNNHTTSDWNCIGIRVMPNI